LAERKEIVCKMVSQGMITQKALEIASIPRSTYYYKSKGTRKGKQPSDYTLYKGGIVSNDKVINSIENILSEDFIEYGYICTTHQLNDQGYKINKKKVYRLMKERSLLLPKKPVKGQGKTYVKYTSPLCTAPFETIEADIKYIYIQGAKRNAYLITFLDVFTRMALVWTLQWDMKTTRVTGLIGRLFDQWLIPYNVDPLKIQVRIRTDNGSQFIAKRFRERLDDAHISNEYIHPGTPQQNGHIEAFHSTVSNLVCNKYILDTLEQATEIFSRFYDTYNYKRIMKATLYKTPYRFFALWNQGYIVSEVKDKKVNYFFREKSPENPAHSSAEILSPFCEDMIQINACLTH
jgi:putative transposase